MEYLVLPPLLVPFAGVVITLVTRRFRQLQERLALGVILLTLASTVALSFVVISQGGLSMQPGAWPVPIGITLVADPLTVFMLLMTHLVLAMGVFYAIGSTEKATHYPTFYPLFLGLTTGLSGAFLTGDLLNLFVFTEVIVITGAALTGAADDQFGIEAAYKYILISTIAATFFLLGIGSLYAAYGTLNMAQLAELNAITPLSPFALAGLAFLAATFLTKSAAFPFHFWQPDFHAAAPTPVSAMLSSVVVKVGVYGLLRLTSLLFAEVTFFQPLLVVVGVLGVVYGGFGAAGTHNLKRMLAYSTLAQVGFVLLGLGWGTPLALAAALVFAFNHALIKSAMLMLAGAMASRASVKSASFKVVIGVGKYHPLAGGLFLLGGIALAGIPPTNGFISKLLLFWGGVESQNYLSLAIAGVASILTLTYVIRAFMKVWFEPNLEIKPKTGDRLLAPALLVGISLLSGIWPQPLIALAQWTADWLGSPLGYIQLVIK